MLFAIITLVFLMRPLVPGDPVQIMFFGQMSSPAVMDAMREELGLNDPLPVQYVRYLRRCGAGDLGMSVTTRNP